MQTGDETGSSSGGSLQTLKPFLLLVGLIGLGGVSSQAAAGVEVRVESRPMDQPIDAYVLVTDGTTPVAGLTAQEFQVMLDGVPLDPIEFASPPREDPAQNVSIVIVAQGPLFGDFGYGHTTLLNRLKVGDYVSVVRFWSNFDPELNSGASGFTTLPFTRIDNGQGSQAISDFLEAPAPTGLNDGGKLFLDGLRRGLREFAAPDVPLPDGPKAIVTVAEGASPDASYTLSDVIGAANDLSIPIFNVELADARSQATIAAGEALPKNTGGVHVQGVGIGPALRKIATWLEAGYRITLPPDAVTDCRRHVLEIVVRGETSSRRFVRCDTTPDPFIFRTRKDVNLNTVVVSDPKIIKGIDTAVGVEVFDGEYSIGCKATFTSDPGVIQPGQSVCLRHRSRSESGKYATTWLQVGGELGRFSSETTFD